jgi:transposase
MSNQMKQSTEAAVREIRRRSRRKFSPEEKIRIVLEGLRGEQSVSELCRREGIAANLYYRWSKDFLEAGKKQLAGDTVREATSDEVKDLRSENRELKEVVAEITLKNRVLKKSLTGFATRSPLLGRVGTRSRRRSRSRCSTWRSSGPTSRRESWLATTRTRSATSCRNRAFTAS